jgi:hypothetical protein
MPIEDEFMYMMVLQYGLDYKLLDLTNRDISSPTRQDSWNHPEQNGIAQNKMESPITKWNRLEQNGIDHNQPESPIT